MSRMIGLDLSASQRLQTTLNLSQRQSLRVLQMPSTELRDEAERLAAENPFLEIDTERPAEPSDIPSDENFTLERTDLPIDHLYDRWPVAEESSADPWDAQAREETLGEHLRAQMGFLSLADDTRAALLYLIDALDEHGLLPTTLDAIRKEANETISPDDWHSALKILRSFDPTGVGAFSRGEMLCLQVDELLKEREVDPETAEAFRRLAASGLEGLARLRTPNSGLSCDLRDKVLSLLSKLRPNITSGFAETPVQYVRPDVWVEPLPDEGLRFTLLRGAAPVVTLVQSGERATHDDHLRELWQEAKAFVRAVEARKETLLRIIRFAGMRQEAFFRRGPDALVPLTQQETASALGLADSTVSRTVTSKYFRCPHGTYELQTLFPGPGHAGPSREAVIERIYGWVKNEDPAHPLSDTKLTAMLTEAGFDVARRTVAKYRTEAGIPSPSERRRKG